MELRESGDDRLPGGFELRVLGSIEAVLNDRFLPLGHIKQRCVLAVLAVEANQVVSRDQLIDRIWDDRPPRSVTNVLYGYLGKLRALLAPAGPAATVERQPGGYRLTVDTDRVDLHRFRRLVATGRGDDRAALDEALRLWRGEAFTGAASRWLDGVRQRAGDERFEAVLDRNDLALRTGRSGGRLLGELRALTGEHPFNQRLVGQLMLALHQAGLTGEALGVYAGTRRRMRDELGVDPGGELRDLERWLLDSDRLTDDGATGALTGHQPDPAGAESPYRDRYVPRELPAGPDRFTGRSREPTVLDAVLTTPGRAGPALIAVTGMPGVGKTAFAVRWAHRVAERFPDGQLFVDLRGFDPAAAAMDSGEAVRMLLAALQVPPDRAPATLAAQVNLYRSLTAGKRILVVLDNARDAGQIRPLLPGAPDSAVLVTSRNQLTSLVAVEGAHPLRMGPLAVEEAHDLLADRLGADRLAAEPQAIAEITQRCAGLPLALAVLAARAATSGFPLAVLADELRRADGVLDPFAGGDTSIDVRAVFSSSYHALTPGAARMLRLLARHPGPDAATATAARLAGVPVPRARPLLSELVEAHLLGEHTPGRFTFHELVRAYAAELVDPGADGRGGARHRLLDHYLRTPYPAARVAGPVLERAGTGPAAGGGPVVH